MIKFGECVAVCLWQLASEKLILPQLTSPFVAAAAASVEDADVKSTCIT